MMALVTAPGVYDDLEYHAWSLRTYAVGDVRISSSSKCVRYARLSHSLWGRMLLVMSSATSGYDELEYHARLLGTYAVGDVLIGSSKCVRYIRLSHSLLGRMLLVMAPTSGYDDLEQHTRCSTAGDDGIVSWLLWWGW
jgi:hypothetical protein